MSKDKESPTVWFTPKAKKAYFTFVNTARLVNQKHHVSEDLIHIFNLGTTLLNLRMQRHSGGGVKPTRE